MNDFFTYFLIILILFIASYYDIKTCEVPYYLTFSAILIAIITALYSNNTKILLLAGFISIIIAWILAEFNVWGGADSQLLIAMSLLLGFSWFFIIFIYISMVYSLFFLCLEKHLKKELKIPFVPVFLITFFIFLIN